MTKEGMYLIQDSRSYLGNDVLWWRSEGKGYTTDFDDAGLFTKERAEDQHRSRSTDIPHRYEDILPLVGPRRIDAQKLPRRKPKAKAVAPKPPARPRQS